MTTFQTDSTPKACNVNNRRWSGAEPAESVPASHTAPAGAEQAFVKREITL